MPRYGLITKEAKRCSVVFKLAGAAIDGYMENRKFYNDFVKFNFVNGIKTVKSYGQVNFFDPPPQESRRLNELYRVFGNLSDADIYRALNMPIMQTNKHSPIEAKWAFTYFKKYGHWNYFPSNSITRKEILAPLTAIEAGEYRQLF